MTSSAASAALAMSAFAEPTRRAILDRLVEGERAVSDLVAALDASQPSISQHLRVLLDAGIVTVRTGRSVGSPALVSPSTSRPRPPRCSRAGACLRRAPSPSRYPVRRAPSSWASRTSSSPAIACRTWCAASSARGSWRLTAARVEGAERLGEREEGAAIRGALLSFLAAVCGGLP